MTNKNEQLSRGEVRLNSESTHAQSLENITEHSELQTDSYPAYDAENSELDAMLRESTTTKAETREAEREEKAKEVPLISDEDACNYALMGLGELQNELQKHTGRQVEFGQKTAMLFSMLCAPVIQKYGRNLMQLKGDNIDLDSYTPEMMAAGGLAVVAGSAWFSLKDAPPLPEDEQTSDAESGDKHGNQS